LAFDYGEPDVVSGYLTVTRFAANFEQKCGDSDATLYGTIRINIPADDSE
jgi:hypothetical protein